VNKKIIQHIKKCSHFLETTQRQNKNSVCTFVMGKNKLKIPDSDKLNVLCLHGYRQNAESFRNKTGSFRKFTGNYANFTYISAEHLAKTDDNDGEQKSWWGNKDDNSFRGTNQDGPAIGFEASLKQVERVWREGNFQALVGFSQGASFVSLICSMSERNRE
jgi:hypothetical protein